MCAFSSKAISIDHVLGAAVLIGHEAAGALVGPFHRTAKRAGAVQDADVFRIDRGLHAERAADLAGDDAHLVGRRAENIHQRGLHAVHALAGGIERPLSRLGVEFADRGARLHGVDHHALIGGCQPRHVLGFGECVGDLFGVAIVKIEREIVRHGVEQQRRARLDRFGRREHRRQRLDVERDRLGGVLGLRNRLGDDAGDRIADKTHFVGGERRTRRVVDRRAVAVLQRKPAFEPAITFEIGRGIDRQHARHRLGRGGVDRPDDTMRLAAADQHGVSLAGPADVVGIAAFAAHQFGVFAAADRLANAEFGQGKRNFCGSVIHAGKTGFGEWNV